MGAEERRQYKDFAATLKESLAELKYIADTKETMRAEIAERYRILREALSVELLRERDIAELNANHDGIRVNALRDYGIKSVADVCRTSQRALETIPGIGPVMAAKIKRNADALRISAGHSVQVRIDPEKKSTEQRHLVFSLGQMLCLGPYAEQAEQLYEASYSGIMTRLDISEQLGSGIGWFFSSGEKKQQALLAYEELKVYVADSYAAEGAKIINGFRMTQVPTEEQSWNNFCLNSAPYYTLLYSIIEGNTEAQTDYGGIPEELVSRVNEYTLNTNGLHAELRRYQVFGAKYILYGKRVLLGDEMGLGKTIEAIAAMAHLREEGKTHFLVVCPLSVLMNWQREVARFSNIPVDEIYGNDRAEELEEWIQKGGTAITTYETASKISIPDGMVIDMLTVDEAQYVKNPDALRTKAVRFLAERSECVLFMSGTPLENRVEEMISLVDCLQPEIVPRIRRLTSLADAEQFRLEIAPVYLRRTREQVLKELPEKEEISEWGILSDAEKEAYRVSLSEGNFMSVRRISWNVPNPYESTKGRRMLEIIEEAEGDGRKTIVFSFFRETLAAVSTLLKDRCAGVIDGSMPSSKRQELLDVFQKDDSKTVLACQVIAGGVGLNVQVASVIIFCEPQLKPSMEEQAIGRAYRMGQSRKVMVHRLLISDSVDERIMSVLAGKWEIFQAFADESVVGTIGNEHDITTETMEKIVAVERDKYLNSATDDNVGTKEEDTSDGESNA